MKHDVTGRPRDIAITDFCLTTVAEGLLTGRNGRSYLLYGRITHAASSPAAGGEESVSEPVRRIAEWALYAMCLGAAVAAFWFVFLSPRWTDPSSSTALAAATRPALQNLSGP